MGKKIDYKELYEVQDQVLKTVFSLDNSFYLTGGTALHRFHYNYRYSDDLDLFAPDDGLFAEYLKQVYDRFEADNIKLEKLVQSRDFHRIKAADTLQIDFVNDRVYRDGNSVIKNGFRVDNIQNILTNKISAILSRDEEKDFFDLFCIAFNESFDWAQILESANKKSIVQPEMLIYRIKSFPLEWLNNIKRTESELIITDKDIDTICDDIIEKRNNTLMRNK
ncbi:MAG: nucleotidyl transferase AbiEii/AbiGii toxin family protein [Candidatus Delongbacteria bacterium]|nr:nucleotidyl transferase AbiEii/AbiGii toxin family protein [Candidatus Delongbacteria bacterium]MDD4204508.1 nucleotidyl transferase AbiEii/AbiGii toxin family protein [Candidatus Delongbacteria bacterium]